MPRTPDGCFSRGQVAAAAGIPKSTWNAWEWRGQLPVRPAGGDSRYRRLETIDAIRVAAQHALTLSGIKASAATLIVRAIQEGEYPEALSIPSGAPGVQITMDVRAIAEQVQERLGGTQH